MLVINQAISIVSEGAGAYIGSYGAQSGIAVNAGPNDVVHLRGLIVDGGGYSDFGILFHTGAALHIDHCVFKNVKAASTDRGYGIGFFPGAASPSDLFVSDTTVIDNGNAANGGGGIWIAPEAPSPIRVVLNRVEANDNYRGIKVDGGVIGAGSIVNVNIRDSVFSGNTNNGVVATTPQGGATLLLTLDRVTSSNNGATAPASVGVVSDGPASIVRIGASTVTGNWNGLSFSNGGQLISFGDNKVIGNSNDGSPSAIAAPK